MKTKNLSSLLLCTLALFCIRCTSDEKEDSQKNLPSVFPLDNATWTELFIFDPETIDGSFGRKEFYISYSLRGDTVLEGIKRKENDFAFWIQGQVPLNYKHIGLKVWAVPCICLRL